MWHSMLLPDTSVATIDKAAKYLMKKFPHLNDGWLFYYNEDVAWAITKLKEYTEPTLRWSEDNPFVFWGHERQSRDVIHTLPMDNIFIGEL